MNRIPLANRAVAAPLLGLMLAWVFFMVSQFVDLYTPQPEWDQYGNIVAGENIINFGVYFRLLGIAAGAVLSLVGLNWALHARKLNGEDDMLSRAAHRFTTLAVIVGLGAGAIFAIGSFLGAFNNYGPRDDVAIRFIDVYLPILLATALVIVVLLRAFVFRKDDMHQEDGKKAKLTARQKALGLGYAVPILATAVAIIFGLIVYDVTRTDLQVWVWVIIQVIIALGIVQGTRFANRAKTGEVLPAKPRGAFAAAGASNLNFVLSIVFGTVVSIMSFTFGFAAIENLRRWDIPVDPSEGKEISTMPTIEMPDLPWLIEDFLPAKILLLLAVVGIYLTITERNRKADRVTGK